MIKPREALEEAGAEAKIRLAAADNATKEASVSYLLFIYVRLRESQPIPREADFR